MYSDRACRYYGGVRRPGRTYATVPQQTPYLTAGRDGGGTD